jgi:tight adherence protein C
MTLDPLLITSILIFAAVASAAYAISSRIASDRNPVEARLRQLRTAYSGDAHVRFGERPPLLLKLIATLGGFLPANEGRDALRTGLVRAGFRRGDAVLVFLGTKIVCAVGMPLLVTGFATIANRPIGNIVMLSMIAAGVGFYFPTLIVAILQRRRHGIILSALPDALDLMVVCVEAGLGMAAALQRVGLEMRLASPQLSEELALVNREMQTGISRSDSLRNLAQRTGVEDIYSLVAMLIQTDRLGTSIAQALRAHAESMRTRRRQRAEQLARKASIKLAFPLVFLIFPALLVILLGPSAIQLMKALSEKH